MPVTSQVDSTSAVVRSPPREGWTPVHVMEDRWRRWSSYLLGKWRSDAESEAYNLSRCHRHRWPRGLGPGTTTELRFASAWERTGRTERAHLSWRYFVKHVLRDRAAIRKERARQAALAESARIVRNRQLTRRCACPRGCTKIVHGAALYCDY